MNSHAVLHWRDLWNLYCPDQGQDDFDRLGWVHQSPPPDIEAMGPVEFCDHLARLYAIYVTDEHRKANGQFFTPPAIARFMANLSQPPNPGGWVVEPGAGTGILIAALAERWTKLRACEAWHVTAYEKDLRLWPALALALGRIRDWLGKQGVLFSSEVRPDDFILANGPQLRPAPLLDGVAEGPAPHLIIANPPYFKLPKADPRVALLAEVVQGQPNIYALFMAASAKLLRAKGQLIFITPRSFCSGPYFRQFRKWFFQSIALRRLHLFESRTETFARDNVLQESIVLSGVKMPSEPGALDISSSRGAADLESARVHTLPLSQVLDLASPEAILSIPIDPADIAIQEIFSRWPDRLNTLGLEISTGPVVPFRTQALVHESDGEATAPLLWAQHVGRMAVTWPLRGFTKPQWIRIGVGTHHLLLPNNNLVLVRRFSPKEENSRITAAPHLRDELPSGFVGIENHVNYIHKPGGSLSDCEAVGLAAFLNSRWVEHYFRTFSGNTQVSATELRNLLLPPADKIHRIGERLRAANGASLVSLINPIVAEELGLPIELATNDGGHMSKIEEAKDLLNTLGLPPAQRNDLAALTLLALANLAEVTPWPKAERRSIRIHDMILFVEQNYRKRYAENTRETFRRQVLHQFEQARIADRNPEDPNLPTNSPRTHYALSEAVLSVVQSYGTRSNQRWLEKFKAEQGTLVEVYQQRRQQSLIPVKAPSGQKFRLSPGKHNQLQVAVIEQFVPQAKLLYLGDTANKILYLDVKALQRLGFPADKHGKLPDIVLYSPKKKWLFLIEVVTAHGPVSHKRYRELETLLAKSPAGRVYVSAFPDFKEYLRHVREIAWETEIWIAEAPDHLIHYNGDKFIGPRPRPKRKVR
jgi:adenine-specific DNA-methyltransferase